MHVSCQHLELAKVTLDDLRLLLQPDLVIGTLAIQTLVSNPLLLWLLVLREPKEITSKCTSIFGQTNLSEFGKLLARLLCHQLLQHLNHLIAHPSDLAQA